MKKNKATLLLALLAALLLCACAKEPSSPEDTAPQSEEATTNERDLGALLGEEKNERLCVFFFRFFTYGKCFLCGIPALSRRKLCLERREK